MYRNHFCCTDCAVLGQSKITRERVITKTDRPPCNVQILYVADCNLFPRLTRDEFRVSDFDGCNFFNEKNRDKPCRTSREHFQRLSLVIVKWRQIQNRKRFLAVEHFLKLEPSAL